MSLSKESFQVPVGYTLQQPPEKEKDWRLIRDSDGRRIDASNRSFDLIDRMCGQLISKTVNGLIETKQSIRILDVAGGMGSIAADDLAKRYGQTVRVYNADIIADGFNHEANVYPVQTDAERLSFLDNSMDLVYSYQFLPYYRMHENLEGELRTLTEVRRVLKPGGIAILDESIISRSKNLDVKRYEENMGVSFSVVSRGHPFWKRMYLLRQNKLYSPNFLVMTKPVLTVRNEGSAQVPSL